MRGTWYLSAWRQTVSDCGSTPATESNSATAPSSTRSERSTSTVKSTWPGVSMMLMRWSCPLARGGRGGDRDAALLLLLHPVHRRRALVDLAHLVGAAGVVEDALGRRRLARVDVGHDPDVAGLLEGELARHGVLFSVCGLPASVVAPTGGKKTGPWRARCLHMLQARPRRGWAMSRGSPCEGPGSTAGRSARQRPPNIAGVAASAAAATSSVRPCPDAGRAPLSRRRSRLSRPSGRACRARAAASSRSWPRRPRRAGTSRTRGAAARPRRRAA